MEHTYWPDWEKFLQKHGLKPVVRDLLTNSSSIVNLLSQVMVLGIPLFRGFPHSQAYIALVETLGDRERLSSFSNFLMEAGE